MWRLSVLCLLASASAQIPSLGWCPDFQPMVNFNMNRFLGTWFEVERYFTVSELGTRCVATNYISTPEGRILVSNEITNYITGLKRLMEGHIQMVGREGEGRFMVKYSSLPLPYDYEYSILDTDYDSYAVMWSCSGLGPVHTQSAWLLTRDRLPSLMTMQKAYAVLDRFKISRAFFVKTNQADCTVLPDPIADPNYEEGKKIDVIEKSAGVIVDNVKKVENPVEKVVVPEVVKPEVPQERSAVPEPAVDDAKPLQVPELIMSESEKKEEAVEQPVLKLDAPEKPVESEMKEKEAELPQRQAEAQ
ncbi:apolipoprotein D-like [Ostrinia nubilalis]|uniref:apolipoprotein D-like n=1 Tax=Ostrinia nubilalis TaxID=29057 RepID=UPI00308257B7